MDDVPQAMTTEEDASREPTTASLTADSMALTVSHKGGNEMSWLELLFLDIKEDSGALIDSFGDQSDMKCCHVAVKKKG